MGVLKIAIALRDIFLMCFAQTQAIIHAISQTGPAQAEAARLMSTFSTVCREPAPQLLTDRMEFTWEIIFATHAHKRLMIPLASQ